jgi:uncharacterized membrane protein YbhN (UPF0104 family)
MKRYFSESIQWMLGIAISIGILFWLFESMAQEGKGFSLEDLAAIIKNLPLWAVGIAVGCQLAQTLFRSLRYQVLLSAHNHPKPSYSRLLGITFVRNMLVDFLPSRSGELSYVLLLKRVLGARFSQGFATMGASFVFDLVALLLLISIVGMISLLGTSGEDLFPLVGMLTVLVAFIYTVFFHVLPWAVLATSQWRCRWLSFSWISWANNLADDTAHSIHDLRSSGKTLKVLGLSVVIRFFKYGGIVLLLFMVLTHAFKPLGLDSIGALLLGIVAGEAAAGLPIPSLMSFGTYEAGASFTLQALGFSAQAALISVFVIHLISQLVDYSLGILALFIMASLGWLQSKQPEERIQAGKIRFWFALGALAVVGAGSVGWILFKLNQSKHSPQLTTAAQVQAAGPGAIAEETALTMPSEGSPEGFVVWVSNRFGNHDLVSYDLKSGELTRLTETLQMEWYPSISPDGKWVVFARSHERGQSFRNPAGWSIVVLNLESGEETVVAAEGFEPVWGGDSDTIIYVIQGRQVVLHRISTNASEILLEAGKAGIPSGFVFQTPDYNPQDGTIAVTIRGVRRTKMIYQPPGTILAELPDGCQLIWRPGYESLAYVNNGQWGGTFLSVDRTTLAESTLHEVAGVSAHRYFPRFSQDGNWMVYAESTAGHPHDEGDYDIMLWKTGTTVDTVKRLSQDPGNDAWPDIWITNAK